MISSGARVALRTALLAVLGVLVAPSADARMVATTECKWFGTAPICRGSCPKGWTPRGYNKTGDGERCFSGQKAYCCHFPLTCVPEIDPTFRPNNKRTRYDGVIECQRCTRPGDDCKRGGPPRFNTACAASVWEPCGRGPPPQPTAPRPTEPKGRPVPTTPIAVPGSPLPDPPSCKPPRITARSGACVCPTGLTGEFCTDLIVR